MRSNAWCQCTVAILNNTKCSKKIGKLISNHRTIKLDYITCTFLPIHKFSYHPILIFLKLYDYHISSLQKMSESSPKFSLFFHIAS